MSFILGGVLAQKKIIDSNAYANWESILTSHQMITNNGKYVVYKVAVGSSFNAKLLKMVIQSTNNNEKTEVFSRVIGQPKITIDSKFLVFIKGRDTLGVFNFESKSMEYIPHVLSFDIPTSGNSKILCYQMNNPSKEMIVHNFDNGKNRLFKNVESSFLGKDGQVLILKRKYFEDNIKGESLNWIDLQKDEIREIWKGNNSEQITYNLEFNQLAFKESDSILYYRKGLNRVICITNQKRANLEKPLQLGRLGDFSKDGKNLFIYLQEYNKQKPKNDAVEVWSYTDVRLQSYQQNELGQKTYLGILNLRNQKITRLQEENESNFQFMSINDTVALTKYGQNVNSEMFWNKAGKLRAALISLKDGRRTPLPQLEDSFNILSSLNGKYLLYMDKSRVNYYSYEISTGLIQNLTRSSSNWIGGGAILGWTENDKFVLIFHENDLWQLDPSGKTKPINVTNGYGKKHNVIFSALLQEYAERPISDDEKLILTAFNSVTKDAGFYSISINKVRDPELLTMGPYAYGYYQLVAGSSLGSPLKAKNTGEYLIGRMSASQAPNYFITKDFKKFVSLTDVDPKKGYNWYTSELHSWTSLDGQKLQGVLYKPQDFDSDKKYPIILHYYEELSDHLNVYLPPRACTGGMNINIPTCVSNGYLVFCPDIHYQIGNPMQGTYDAVISAAKYLSHLPFVNEKKMGIQGGSWGGIQTNYLIANTNLFSAASSSAGISDWISGYGTIDEGGESLQSNIDHGQLRVGQTLWEVPDIYIKNSSVLTAHRITTPFLMMHTKHDGISPYQNMIELFVGLRRLGKKAWLLSYDGNHGVTNKLENDLGIRMMQFFDHYLKDKPAPIWMLDGISASRRGIDTGLQLDSTGRTPGPGLLTPEEQRKVDKLMTRKPILIELK